MHEHRTMNPAEAGEQFVTVIDHLRTSEARIVVEDRGVPVAAIISARDLARLDRLDAKREADFRIIDDLRGAFSDVSDEEIEREADRVLGTVAVDEEPSNS